MNNLSKKETYIIGILRSSLRSFKQRIFLPRIIDELQLQKIGLMLLNSDPSFFGIKGFQFAISRTTICVSPDYLYDKVEAEALLLKCESQRSKLLRNLTSNGTYETVQKLHDILSRNVKYVMGDDPELHSIVGPLTKRIGVCEGFAKTLKFILDELSIPSIVVTGMGYNQLTQQEEPHAWNLVQTDGEWTHIDLTFDTTIREHDVPRYDYFGLTNEEILKDHKFNVSSYPEARSRGLSYYERNGLVMKKKSSLNVFLLDALQTGKKDIVFKLPDTASESNVEVQVTSEINNFLSQNNFYMGYMLYYNAKQKVFHVHLEG